MKKIGILSDTHAYFDDKLRFFFDDVDELWHVGDFGSIATADAIAAFKPLVGVYGNIDDATTRRSFPRVQFFEREGATILMTHIGGHPKRYEAGVEDMILKYRPDIFISGHSHILKVVNDRRLNLLHVNPGAAGLSGFHRVRTAIRCTLDDGRFTELEVGEWARRLDK